MRTSIARAITTFAVAVAISAGITTPAQAATGIAGDVYAMVNQQRASNGLGPLLTDGTLDYAATVWAQHLAATGQFIHSSAQWRTDMISGAGWTFSGENIAAGYSTASGVMNAWMNSDGHRANILNSSYVGVGIGYAQGGPYGHYWVQIFAGSHPRVAPGAAPVISGSTVVGQTVTASASGWPGGTTFSWSWASNGIPIPGANSASYLPTISDAGRKLTVTVTGSLPGYYPATKTSNASATITGGATSSRLAGVDRFDTSATISRNGFSPGVEVAYVASGMNFPDALGAAPAATLFGGPLLLTNPAELSGSVDVELRRLAPERIVVVGSSASVSNAVADQLSSIAPTTRIAGADRFETSRSIVADAFDSASIAYIATGMKFPDALTAGAAAAHLQAPVLLVSGGESSLDPLTIDLLRSLGVTSVRIVGDSNSVSGGIQSSLVNSGFSVDRRSGPDRFETANAINTQVFSSTPVVYLASGMDFPDALAGAALAGSKDSPLYLATSTCIPASASHAMTLMGATQVVLLGGTASLSSAVSSFQRC